MNFNNIQNTTLYTIPAANLHKFFGFCKALFPYRSAQQNKESKHIGEMKKAPTLCRIGAFRLRSLKDLNLGPSD